MVYDALRIVMRDESCIRTGGDDRKKKDIGSVRGWSEAYERSISRSDRPATDEGQVKRDHSA